MRIETYEAHEERWRRQRRNARYIAAAAIILSAAAWGCSKTNSVAPKPDAQTVTDQQPQHPRVIVESPEKK